MSPSRTGVNDEGNPNHELQGDAKWRSWNERPAIKPVLLVSYFVIRAPSFSLKLRFLDLIPAHLSLGAAGKLAGENRRRVGRNDLVAFEDEFWVNGVAGGLVDLVAAEVTVELVFVIIVAPELEALAIGGQLLLLVQHYELRFAPRLPGTADVAPEFEVGFIISTANKIIAWGFGGIFLRHRHFCGLNAGRGRFASSQKEQG